MLLDLIMEQNLLLLLHPYQNIDLQTFPVHKTSPHHLQMRIFYFDMPLLHIDYYEYQNSAHSTP